MLALLLLVTDRIARFDSLSGLITLPDIAASLGNSPDGLRRCYFPCQIAKFRYRYGQREERTKGVMRKE